MGPGVASDSCASENSERTVKSRMRMVGLIDQDLFSSHSTWMCIDSFDGSCFKTTEQFYGVLPSEDTLNSGPTRPLHQVERELRARLRLSNQNREAGANPIAEVPRRGIAFQVSCHRILGLTSVDGARLLSTEQIRPLNDDLRSSLRAEQSATGPDGHIAPLAIFNTHHLSANVDVHQV